MHRHASSPQVGLKKLVQDFLVSKGTWRVSNTHWPASSKLICLSRVWPSLLPFSPGDPDNLHGPAVCRYLNENAQEWHVPKCALGEDLSAMPCHDALLID